MRISDWSSDVCSSDLLLARRIEERDGQALTSRHRVIGSARKELQRYVACAYRFYAMFVLRIGDALADAGDPCTLKAWATAFRAGCAGIQSLGGGTDGDRTMADEIGRGACGERVG